MGIGKGIIFIDLNGTLLDKVDKLSVPIEILQSAIKSVQSAGWVVGLCSDSPLEPLVEYQEKIRAIGPTLAENGTLFFDNRIITKLKEINNISTLKQKILKAAFSLGAQHFPDYLSPEFCSDYLIEQEGLGIAFGAYRKSTISVFALFANNGACIPNSALVKDISKELLALLEGHGQLDYYCGAEHGFISVQPGRCKLNKQDGLTYVANMCASLFMIGDDWRDIAEHSSVKTALVGNADSALKDKVTYVSSKPYTEGVVDILNKIREGKL